MKIRSQILFVFLFIFLSFSYSQEGGNTAETIKKAMDHYMRAETMFETRKYRLADSLYFLAQEEFQKKKQGEYFISCLIQRARIKFSTGSINTAAELLDKTEAAFDVYQISHKDSLFSNFLNRKGYYYILSRDYRQAENAYLEAVEIRLVLQMKDHALSLMCNNLGFIYDQQGEYMKAEDYFTKSLEIGKEVIAPGDIRLAKTCINLGGFMAKIAKIERSKEYLESAKEIYIDQYGPDYIDLGKVYTNMGVLSYKSGDYNEARDYFLESVRLFSRSPVDYALDLVSCYNNLGLCEHEEKNIKEALNWYLQSVELAKWRDPASLGRTYNKIANAYKDLHEELVAEQYFNLSIDNTLQYKGHKHLDLASAYMNYGIFLMEKLDHNPALENYTKALKLYLENYGSKHPATSRCFHNISKFYQETGSPDSALKYVQEALIAVVEDFQDMDIYLNPDPEHSLSNLRLLSSLKLKAELLITEFNREELKPDQLKLAFESLKLAILVVEELRMEYQSEESKLFLAANEKSTYNEIVKVAMRLYEMKGDKNYMQTAFQYSEKGKSAILLSAIRDMEAKDFSGIPPDLLQMETEINRQLGFYKEKIYEEKRRSEADANKITLYESYIFDLNHRSDSLLGLLERNYPEYFNLKYQTSVASLQQMQDWLKRDQVLLEYVICDSVLISFLISPNDIMVKQCKMDLSFRDDLSTLRQQLTSATFSSGVKDSYKSFVKASSGVYACLIKPFEEEIADKKLLIVPDEALAYIPFEILLTGQPEYEEMDYSRLDYLLKKHVVSYSPSATLLLHAGMKKPKGASLLAFAPTYPAANMVKHSFESSRQAYRDELYPLPFTIDEVKAIQSITNATIYLNEEANELNFKQTAGNFDILHLAMHTIIDDDNPMYSKLAFSKPAVDNQEDGFLNLTEIYNLRLKARLVVLSSCNSGSGKLKSGEGVMSLARGFMYAGCPNIIMTMWKVDDISGSKIMTGFYSYLKKSYSTEEALRMAKLDYLETASSLRAHPFFWSPYMSMGNSSRIYKDELVGHLLTGFFILLFLLIFLWMTGLLKSLRL